MLFILVEVLMEVFFTYSQTYMIILHSSCWPGKCVRIKLKDGRTFITRFRDKKGTKVITDAETFRVGDLRAFTIYKAK